MKILRCAQDDKGVQDDKGDWVCTLDSILRRGRNDLCELFVTLHDFVFIGRLWQRLLRKMR